MATVNVVPSSDAMREPAPVLDRVRLVPPDQEMLDPRAYFSEVFYDLELRSVFPRTWVFVGDLDALREPGDYLTETIGYEPVVVIRDRNGSLRAFSNVCTHRASLLVEGEGNCGRHIECPYHGWTFRLDGQLVGVPYQKGFGCEIDKEALGLREVRVDTWERLVFVNVSGDAPPLREHLGDVPELLADHDIAGMTPGHALDDEVAANWKFLMDNAVCDYHVPVVHRNSIGKLVDVKDVEDRAGRTTAVAYAPWTEEAGEVEVKPELRGDARTGSFGCYVFPNLHVIGFPTGGATVMWWTPIGIDRTRARVRSYSHAAETDLRAGRELLQAIQNEDFEICEKMQRGARAAGFRPGPRHGNELRIWTFQSRLVEMLADAVAGPSGTSGAARPAVVDEGTGGR